MTHPSDKCVKRLTQEQKLIRASPPEFIKATPEEGNILVWYYVLDGPQGTPYEGGKFLGKVKFPPDYPFAPPSIMMTTPNGRFKTDTRLCLSISDFHPKDWNPIWNAGTILTGLLSFMVGTDQTHGSVETSNTHKKELAKKSHRFNLTQPYYEKLFPDDYAVSKEKIAAEASANNSTSEGDANGDEGEPSKNPVADITSRVLQGIMMGSIGAIFLYVFFGSGS